MLRSSRPLEVCRAREAACSEERRVRRPASRMLRNTSTQRPEWPRSSAGLPAQSAFGGCSKGAVEAPFDSLRRDDHADPRLRAVVAREGVANLFGGEALVLGPGAEQVVETSAAIVEGAE